MQRGKGMTEYFITQRRRKGNLIDIWDMFDKNSFYHDTHPLCTFYNKDMKDFVMDAIKNNTYDKISMGGAEGLAEVEVLPQQGYEV